MSNAVEGPVLSSPTGFSERGAFQITATAVRRFLKPSSAGYYRVQGRRPRTASLRSRFRVGTHFLPSRRRQCDTAVYSTPHARNQHACTVTSASPASYVQAQQSRHLQGLRLEEVGNSTQHTFFVGTKTVKSVHL